MTLIMSFQILQQENSALLMTKIMENMVKEVKVCIKFGKKVKSSLFDYSDAYVLVTVDIKITDVGADTNVSLKSCAPFARSATHINNEHIDTNENVDIIMPIYNLIECSDNYSDTSGSLYQFKRDESPITNAGNPITSVLDNSSFYKYKSGNLGRATVGHDDDDDDDDDDIDHYKM